MTRKVESRTRKPNSPKPAYWLRSSPAVGSSLPSGNHQKFFKEDFGDDFSVRRFYRVCRVCQGVLELSTSISGCTQRQTSNSIPDSRNPTAPAPPPYNSVGAALRSHRRAAGWEGVVDLGSDLVSRTWGRARRSVWCVNSFKIMFAQITPCVSCRISVRKK